jgi:hypothetical protein
MGGSLIQELRFPSVLFNHSDISPLSLESSTYRDLFRAQDWIVPRIVP